MLSTTVVVLDFETTGLSPRSGDRITEVAALRLRGDQVIDQYVTLVNAGVRIPSFITQLTGISNEMVASAPPVKRVMRELISFLDDDIVVAHNASFDHGFLLAETERSGLSVRERRMLCTMRLARRLEPGLASYKLARLAEHLGITYSSRAHRAEADARVAADVLLKLMTRMRDRHQLRQIDPDLLRQVTDWPVRDAPSRLTTVLSKVALSTRRARQ